jgi:hypothetical protein
MAKPSTPKKTRARRFATHEELRAAVRSRCESEYQKTFGQAWRLSDANVYRATPGSKKLDFHDVWEREAVEVSRQLHEAVTHACEFAERAKRAPPQGRFGRVRMGWLVRIVEQFIEPLMRIPGIREWTEPEADRSSQAWIMSQVRLTYPGTMVPRAATPRELAIISLLTGNFPDFVQPLNEVTVAEVIQIEAKHFRKLQQRTGYAKRFTEWPEYRNKRGGRSVSVQRST